MKHLVIAVLLACAMKPASSADVYDIKPAISEEDLVRIYVDCLARYAQYAETQWHDGPFAGAGYWGNGVSSGNEGIRAVSNTALAYAVLIKHSDALDSETSRRYAERAAAGIRYVVETHSTGKQRCVDEKQWGNSWQSAMWTGTVGFAAWILWDELDPELRTAVERVVTYEADRFVDRKPPGNRWGDTKAEENGWDLTCITLAANLLRDRPNAIRWDEAAVRYMMNTISAPQDARDTRVVDGKPVKEWVSTVNTHSDFTIENHGFFHPTYMMVSPAEVGQGAFHYAYAGRPVPEAARHHLLDNWRCLQAFMYPHGYWAYTQGMDWALNSDGHIHYLAWLASYAKGPLAYGMEKTVAQYIAGHQALHGGRFAGPASRLGFAREAIVAERLSYCYLYHRKLGGPDSKETVRQAAGRLNGVRRYIPTDMITHRTNSKFASFSWRNVIMGLAMPIGEGHEGNPYFSTPYTAGFVGIFNLDGKAVRSAHKVSRSWRKIKDGFQTEGVLLTADGRLKQGIRFISIGEKTVVYLDRVTATADITIENEQGAPIGIENDEFTGDRRVLYWQDGEKAVAGSAPGDLIRIPGTWANVDGRLGIVAAQGSGLAYGHVQQYNRDGAREDYLWGSFSDTPREFKAGETVTARAVVVYLETSAEETARLAEQVRFAESGHGRVLRVPLPEGGEYEAAVPR